MAPWASVSRRTRRGTMRAIAVAGILVAAIALSACGPGGPAGSDSGSEQNTGVPGSGSAGPVGPAGPDEAGGSDPVLPWVPAGPASPGDPPQQSWYLLLRDGDCAGLDAAVADGSGAPLWSAAAAMCTAVASGDAADWAQAQAQVAALREASEPPADGCHAEAVYRMLQRAVEFHAQHPALQHISTAPEEGTACKQELYGVQQQEPSGGSGSCDSRWFVLDARLLPTTVLTVDGADVSLTVGEREHLYFEMPVREPQEVSTIEARTAAGDLVGTVTYEHLEDQCGPSDADPTPTEPGDPGEPTPTPTPTVP
ncbi:hypothetical protein ACI3KY_01115 [Microbacterium sp. ZW T2_14]|uniref:hypothetical protein n=1 Tax=Microbacterium sp. ZW T2_14 TaxID=3378079 RepID=UPI003854C20E